MPEHGEHVMLVNKPIISGLLNPLREIEASAFILKQLIAVVQSENQLPKHIREELIKAIRLSVNLADQAEDQIQR